jgi:MSHA pilin protein MshA
MNSKGFTLIELVVVIVILGILAATAAPKFINLKADAQTATLQGVKAAIEGVVALVHSKSLVKGNHKEAGGTIILADGDPLDIGYGYPLAPGPFDPVSPENYWQRLLSISADDIVIRAATNGKLIFYFSEQGSLFSSNASCIVVYEPPSGVNIKPKVTVNPCT